MKKLLLLIVLVVMFFSSLVWAKPGDTYFCTKKYAKAIFIDSGEKNWGVEHFHFEWSLENKIKFLGAGLLKDFTIKDYDPKGGELFEGRSLLGGYYVTYLEGKLTISDTSNGTIWYVLANCKNLDL